MFCVVVFSGLIDASRLNLNLLKLRFSIGYGSGYGDSSVVLVHGRVLR